MKLRIRGNSIRLRLSQSEVTAIAETGELRETTSFPGGGRLGYGLLASTDCERPQAVFADGQMSIILQQDAVRDWASSDDVGISIALPLADEEKLSLLIEKDFACLKPRDGEDESDMYPHPDPEAC